VTQDNRRPTLPGAEFRRIREHLGLSRDQYAIELGYEGNVNGNRTTIRRFETNERPVPLPVAKLAWLFSQSGLPESWPSGLEAQVEDDAAFQS
jgi:transcriptional regulator with XRE-family HTH domain